MMGNSVVLVILTVSTVVFGEFNYAKGETPTRSSNLPRKINIHSPSPTPMHASKPYLPFHSPASSPSGHMALVHGSAPSPEPRTFIRHSSIPPKAPSPSLSLVPSTTKPVAPVASMGVLFSAVVQKTHAPMTQKMYHLKLLILVAIIFVPLILGAIMLFAFCTWMYRRDTSPAPPPYQVQTLPKHVANDDSDANKGLSLGPLLNRLNSFRNAKRKGCASVMEYSVLQAATNNFSSNNVLGEGGFGCVYKAQFNDYFFAAVKKLDEDRNQAGDEFHREVELMSKIRHPNLVSLLGFCIHGQTRLLVYELMQNGSLEDQLHGPSHGSALTWYLRLKIALDAARGLEHLHEHCNPSVIHCDFKSSNILLDASFNAKLSDFGLAVTVGEAMGDKNVELLGTLGYVAPEYLLDGKLTEKSDVYAFGVVLLELLTGRKPIDKSMPAGCQSLVTWATPQLTDRSKLPTIVDPMIKETMNSRHLYQVAMAIYWKLGLHYFLELKLGDVLFGIPFMSIVKLDLSATCHSHAYELPVSCSVTHLTNNSIFLVAPKLQYSFLLHYHPRLHQDHSPRGQMAALFPTLSRGIEWVPYHSFAFFCSQILFYVSSPDCLAYYYYHFYSSTKILDFSHNSLRLIFFKITDYDLCFYMLCFKRQDNGMITPKVAAVAVLCVQREPSYRPLIADVVHSLIPLIPVELGGALRNADASSIIAMKSMSATNFSTKTTENPEL
eukprot:Gb_00523 [translate_table: standard]